MDKQITVKAQFFFSFLDRVIGIRMGKKGKFIFSKVTLAVSRRAGRSRLLDLDVTGDGKLTFAATLPTSDHLLGGGERSYLDLLLEILDVVDGQIQHV